MISVISTMINPKKDITGNKSLIPEADYPNLNTFKKSLLSVYKKLTKYEYLTFNMRIDTILILVT